MRPEKTSRGFVVVTHPIYAGEGESRLVQESSAIGDYDDSMENPGSSYLWIGADHHLNREQVQKFVGILRHWLKNGRLHYCQEEQDPQFEGARDLSS